MFGRVNDLQISGSERIDGEDWRLGLTYFVGEMRRGVGSVARRPTIRFATPKRMGFSDRTIFLECWTPWTDYFAYGQSDRSDGVEIASARMRPRIDMIVDGACANVLTALQALANSRGPNAVAIRLRRLVGEGASFHLWTDGFLLHAAAVGVLADPSDACDLARLRATRMSRAAA